MSILSRMMPEPRRPPLACEITPNAVIAGRRGAEAGVLAATSSLGLPAGMIAPGWREANLVDAKALSAALRQTLDKVSAGNKNVTLIVPDSSVRVLTLDFDTLPDREKDALPIIKFRLRKLLPFEADAAAVTYQTFGAKGQVRAITAATPQLVRAEYEAAVREAGFEPGALLPATLAALPLLNGDAPALLVHLAGDSVTITIVNGEMLLLHRVLELGNDDDEEIAQAIVVARAYFEDTLGSSPDTIVASGLNSLARLRTILDGQFGVESHITLRPLMTATHFPADAVPPGSEREMFGSVAGALS